MHSSVLKRPTLNQYVGLALALGLAASLALNVVMLARSGNDAAHVADAPATSIRSANAMRRFVDAKENQLDAAPAAISPRTTSSARTLKFYARKEIKLDEFYSAPGQSRQNPAPAVDSLNFDNEFGQVDVMQMQAEESAVFPATSRYIGSASGQVDVLQMQADENSVLAARERFIKSKFDRMAAGH